jgi:hypothetical protein
MTKKDIDYDKMFLHVKNLKKVLLVATGRTGSDFFQSLLDSHPQILQLPGAWFFQQWWQVARCRNNVSDLVEEFIWQTSPSYNHISKFISCYNTIERWGKLGDKKNESFKVNIDAFRKHMLNIFSERELNRQNFFLALNLAYGMATNIDIFNTKILFYHIHQSDKLAAFKEDFFDFDVIPMVREPRNTLVSGIENWSKYKIDTSYNSSFLHYTLRRIFHGAETILLYTNNIRSIKLEDLHLYPEVVMREFCGAYGLKHDDCLFHSTYHGKKWWGDEISGKYLDGFSNNVTKKKWSGKLSFYDNFLIEYLLGSRLKHYGYDHKNKLPLISPLISILLIFLPMKYEVKILLYNLKSSENLKDFSNAMVWGTFYYLLRVRLYLHFTIKRVFNSIYLEKYYTKDIVKL